MFALDVERFFNRIHLGTDWKNSKKLNEDASLLELFLEMNKEVSKKLKENSDKFRGILDHY